MVIDNSLENLEATIVFDSRDWSRDATDALIYGIVVGWDDVSLEELAGKYRWSVEKIDLIRDLHQDFIDRKNIDTMFMLELEEGGA